MSGLKVIIEGLACTFQPRQWGRGNSTPVSAVAPFSDLAPLTVDYDPDDPAAATRQVQRAKKRLQYSCLHEDAEPMTGTRLKGLTGGHRFWTKIVECSRMRHYGYENSEVDRFELERQTRRQGDKLWMEAKRGMITASLVGQIFALRETASRQPTIDTIMQQNIEDLQHIPVIKHGRT